MCSCGKDKCEYAKYEADKLKAEYKENISAMDKQLTKLDRERWESNYQWVSREQRLTNQPNIVLLEQLEREIGYYKQLENDLYSTIDSINYEKQICTKEYEFYRERLLNLCPNNAVTKKIRKTI